MPVAVSSDEGGVFLSWTRADTDRTGDLRRLVDALRSAGVPVWIDDAGIDPFDPIPEVVREGLSRSKLLLAWYSAAYPTRRACREELTLALLAAENAGQGERRVLVINPETSLEHVVEARLLDRRFATTEDLAGPAALAGRIAGRLAEVDGPFGSLPIPDPSRWYGGAGWQGSSDRFVGRLAEFWRVHDLLHRTTGLAGAGEAGRSVALVSGFGGVGKSLFAAEYAHLFTSCYPGGIVWLSAAGHAPSGAARTAEQSKAAAYTAMAGVAEFLNFERVPTLSTSSDPSDPSKFLREQMKSELDRRGRAVLWIVDDVATGLDAAGLDEWRCPGPMVHELITTRDHSQSRLPTVDLEVLQPADALSLLTQGRPLPPPERAEAEALAEELGYHPLACDVAGLYIAGSTTFAGYRRLLAGNIGRFDDLAADLGDRLAGDHTPQITATLATSLQQLEPDANAWQLLRLAGQLAPAPIPRWLLVAVFAELTPGGEDAAELALNQALQDRHRDGLWTYDPASTTVTVHVLVSAAAAAIDLQPQRRRPVRQAASAALTTVFDRLGADVRQHAVLNEVAVHASHLAADQDVDPQLLNALALYEWTLAPLLDLLENWRDRADATSKTHYAMANRYSRRNMVLGIPVVVLMTLVGASVFATLQESVNTGMRIVVGVASVLAAVLASLLIFFNYSEKAEKNRAAAENWSAIRREITEMLELHPAGRATRGDPKTYLDGLRTRLDETSAESPEMPDRLWARNLSQTQATDPSGPKAR
jgi:hypothetical protein